MISPRRLSIQDHAANRRAAQAQALARQVKQLGILCLQDGTAPARLRDLATVEAMLIGFAAKINAPNFAPPPTPTPPTPRQGRTPRRDRKGSPL